MTQTKLTGAAILLCCSAQVNALDNQLKLSTGYPTQTQNLDLHRMELSYQRNLILPMLPANWSLSPVFSLGQIMTSAGDATSLGIGSALKYHLNSQFSVFSEGGSYWLSQYSFGERGVAYKNYGGPFQFYYKFGAEFQWDRSWHLGYAYQHMSNGKMYEENPALNTHTLTFSLSF